MPESKTIQIDEITTPQDKGGGESSKRTGPNKAKAAPKKKGQKTNAPFPNVSSLGWKALLTVKITQWFLRIKNKSYAKWIIIPAVILAVILIIPVSILFILWLMIKSIFKPSSKT